MVDLEYGMKILFPCKPISGFSTIIGIAFTDSSSPNEMVEMEVCKYWESDTDANRYKVKLKPISDKDKLRFGNETLYCSDLKSLLNENICTIIN